MQHRLSRCRTLNLRVARAGDIVRGIALSLRAAAPQALTPSRCRAASRATKAAYLSYHDKAWAFLYDAWRPVKQCAATVSRRRMNMVDWTISTFSTSSAETVASASDIFRLSTRRCVLGGMCVISVAFRRRYRLVDACGAAKRGCARRAPPLSLRLHNAPRTASPTLLSHAFHCSRCTAAHHFFAARALRALRGLAGDIAIFGHQSNVDRGAVFWTGDGYLEYLGQ
jgi:hypothetical protein